MRNPAGPGKSLREAVIEKLMARRGVSHADASRAFDKAPNATRVRLLQTEAQLRSIDRRLKGAVAEAKGDKGG